MDINHAAGQHPVAVSRPVFELIRCAKAASLLKDSAFNLAIGPLVKRWKIGFKGDSGTARGRDRRLAGASRNPADRWCWMKPTAACSLLAREWRSIWGPLLKAISPTGCGITCIKKGVELGLINLGGNVQTLGSPEGGWSRRPEKTVRRVRRADWRHGRSKTGRW